MSHSGGAGQSQDNAGNANENKDNNNDNNKQQDEKNNKNSWLRDMWLSMQYYIVFPSFIKEHEDRYAEGIDAYKDYPEKLALLEKEKEENISILYRTMMIWTTIAGVVVGIIFVCIALKFIKDKEARDKYNREKEIDQQVDRAKEESKRNGYVKF